MIDIDPESVAAAIQAHRSRPTIGIDEYLKRRSMALGQAVLARRRIYFDKCFWIMCRDAELGRSKNSSGPALLGTVRSAVRSGKVICPISESLFFELLKQQDLRTRAKTAALIDEFSLGVTLVPLPQRIEQEFAHLICSAMEPDTCTPEQLVWSKLSYLLGVVHPAMPFLGVEEESVMQRAFLDFMWDRSLLEILNQIGDTEGLSFDLARTAMRLNAANSRHADQMVSFRQTYLDEFRGALELFMHVPAQCIEQQYRRTTGSKPVLTDRAKDDQQQEYTRFFGNLISHKQAALKLPTLHIGALCHAAIRGDKQRKLVANDLYDFHHVQAAIPYCDAFFTEKSLCSLLRQERFELADDFSCVIISAAEEAVAWVAAQIDS